MASNFQMVDNPEVGQKERRAQRSLPMASNRTSGSFRRIHIDENRVNQL
jgi:hypothetical protein